MSESDTIFNERDWRCTTVQLMLSTDPSYDNRTIASTLKMQIWFAMNNRDMPRVMKRKFSATVMVFGVVSSEGHIMRPYIFEVSLKVNTKVYLDMLKCGDSLVQSGGWWQPLGVAAGLSASPQVQRDPGFALEGVLRLCTLLSLAPLHPRPEPAGLLCLVIQREHHQHDLPQHQSQPDCRHPPSILWAPAGASRKSMLPIPDPYRGSDWGWRQPHWIDVSSTTLSSFLNGFFQ